MKTTLIFFSVFCLATASCFAQETPAPDGYTMTRNCHDKVKVYLSVNNQPDLTHYKYMSRRYWFKIADVQRLQGSDYVRIYIPDNELVSEAKSAWTEDGKTVDSDDYNTWLYIKMSDLDRFMAFRFPAPVFSNYREQMAQNQVH